ncbi:hypothetical protein FRC12_014953 [Ceratobasidium sp. 428]|nr:hypothetical protein FRC12_014953 [Ceratobasidium sp. 428]
MMEIATAAWESVLASTIRNCWHHTSISTPLPHEPLAEPVFVYYPEMDTSAKYCNVVQRHAMTGNECLNNSLLYLHAIAPTYFAETASAAADVALEFGPLPKHTGPTYDMFKALALEHPTEEGLSVEQIFEEMRFHPQVFF